jgi:hypothetical protein
MFEKKVRLYRRRALVELLVKRGIKATTAHSDVGFMFNHVEPGPFQGPITIVEEAIKSSLDDDDPIAAAMEKLADPRRAKKTPWD